MEQSARLTSVFAIASNKDLLLQWIRPGSKTKYRDESKQHAECYMSSPEFTSLSQLLRQIHNPFIRNYAEHK